MKKKGIKFIEEEAIKDDLDLLLFLWDIKYLGIKKEKLNMDEITKIHSSEKLYEYLYKYDDEINSDNFVLIASWNYLINERKRNISKTKMKEERDKIKKFLDRVMDEKEKELIFSRYDYNNKRNIVQFISYKEIANFFKKKSSNSNLKRIEEKISLEELLKNINIGYIYLFLKLEYRKLGDKIITAIVLNSLEREPNIKTKKELENFLDDDKNDSNLFFNTIEKLCFIKDELSKTIKKDAIEFIDFNKLLLVSAYSEITKLEKNEYKDSKEINGIYNKLKIIKGLLEKREKRGKEDIEIHFRMLFDGSEEEFYSYKMLKRDLKKFINGKYITEDGKNDYREKLLSGETKLTEIDDKIVKILELSDEEKIKIASLDTDNFFQYVKDKSSSEIIDILNIAHNISIDTYIFLYENQLIDKQDIIDLYMNDKISIYDVSKINEKIDLEENISEENLFDMLMESLNQDNLEKRNDYEKFVLLYRNLKMNNKSEDEKNKAMDNLIERIFELYDGEDNSELLIELYNSKLISLEVLVNWGGQEIKDKLFEENLLKSSDIKELYNNNEINIDNIKEKIFSRKLDDFEKINYIFSIFNEDSLEHQKIRNELVQIINLRETNSNYPKENNQKGNKIIKNKSQNNRTSDSYARWRLIQLLDNKCSMDFTQNGYALFYLPNLKNGQVVIEKLYDKKRGRLVDAYGKATYIMSEQQFLSSGIISVNEDNKKFLDSRKLIGMARKHKSEGKQDIVKIVHSKNWGNSIKEYFDVEKDERYSQKHKELIDSAIKSVENSIKKI